MKTLRTLMVAGAVAALGIAAAVAQVPAGLWRFGTSGAYAPQVGNCVSILAMNSSGQVGTDSGTPCTPVALTTAYTNATTAYTAIMALPTVQGPLTLVGECDLTWEGSSASLTPTFAIGASAAPTDLWVTATTAGSAYTAPSYTAITSTTTTAVTGALTTGAGSTPYKTTISFTLQNPAGANTLTIYTESNNASYTVTVEPGSYCAWVP